MKHIFVYNPAAGRNSKVAIEALQEKMKEYDGKLEYEFYYTKSQRDATAFIKERCAAEPDEQLRFYACGGDGTANEVLHGVVGFPNASMTIYPCGSGNDFVKYYGGSEPFLDIDALIAAEETPIDVMRIDDRYALNVTNFGFDAEVAKTMIAVKRKKLIGGKNAYTTGIVKALFTAMKNNCTVWVDGEQLNTGKMLLCTVSNGRYVGGAFCCAPRSDNTDGLLEICLVKPISRFTFVKLLTPYKKGEYLEDPRFEKHITYRRGKEVRVKAPEGFVFSLDGEIVYKNDFVIEICPAAIRFAIPAAPCAKEEPAVEEEPATV